MMKTFQFSKDFFFMIVNLSCLLRLASHWLAKKIDKMPPRGHFKDLMMGPNSRAKPGAFYMECKERTVGSFADKKNRQGNQSYICRNWVEFIQKKSGGGDEQNLLPELSVQL